MTPPTLLFNPSRLETEELEATFVGRGKLLERLEQDIRLDAANRTARHWMLVGLRGMGKSHLVELLARRLQNKHGFDVVRMPEEHYQVGSLAELLEQIVARLAGGASPFADDPDPERVELHAIDLLRRREGSLLVVIENLGSLLRKLSTRDQHRLRELLMRDAPFLLLATAPGPVEATTDHNAPFYDFFHTLTMDELTREEVRALVTTRMQRDRARGFLSHDEDVLGRFDALYHFSGGNPRLVLALYGVLREGVTETFYQQMLELLDRITPYYQARLSDISPQMARVLTEMALADGPLTPAEIARRTRLKTNQVTANLNKLSEEQLVRPGDRPDQRRRYYEVIDRLFRIWLQMREDRSSRKRFRFLAEFYGLVYAADKTIAWQLAEHLRDQFWRGASSGDALLARESALTLAHLGPALGQGDDVVRVVLDGGSPPANEEELLALEKQFALFSTLEERQAVALRLVEGWDEHGARAERAFHILDAVVADGAVPWRLGCWYHALSVELGRSQNREAELRFEADTPAIAIIREFSRGGGGIRTLLDEHLAQFEQREQRALLRLASAVFPGMIRDGWFESPHDPPTPIAGAIEGRFPKGVPSGAYPNVTLLIDPGWSTRCLLIKKGFLGTASAFAVIEHIAVSAERDDIVSWLKETVPDWPMLRWVLLRAREPWVLAPYAQLRAAGYLEPISPLEAALTVRDASDRAAALMALHPEEREAVEILLAGRA